MAKRPFRRRSDLELQRLSDEEVVAYIVAARAAGESGEVTKAFRILVYGRMRFVEAMVANKVPEHQVDKVARKAMIDTMEAVFDGESVGQFVNFLKTVTQRRIADHLRSEGRRGHEDPILDEESESRRRREVEDPDQEVEAVPVHAIVDELLERRSPAHRAVVELAVFDDLPSKDVADEVNRRFPDLDDPMTVANVDQITSRFRKDLRRALDDGDTA